MVQKYVFLLILSCCIACAPKEADHVPDDVLSREKMSEVLADIHLAESVLAIRPHGADTNARQALSYYRQVYAKHGITREQFSSSYNFYLHHPELLDSVYADIITKLSNREVELRKK